MKKLDGVSIIKYERDGDLITVKTNPIYIDFDKSINNDISLSCTQTIKCKFYLGDIINSIKKIKSIQPIILKVEANKIDGEKSILKIDYGVSLCYIRNGKEYLIFQKFTAYSKKCKYKNITSLKILNNVSWNYINDRNIEILFEITWI